MKLRKLSVLGLASVLVVGLSGVTASSAAAVDEYGTITGKVTYLSKPVVGAQVWAEGTNGEWGGAGTTDSTGTHSIDWVSAGSYVVRVDNSVYDAATGLTVPFDFLSTYSGNTVRRPEAKAYAVTGGATTSVATISAVKGATLRGKVVDAKGKPAKGVSVQASNLTRSGWSTATTDAKGTYVLRGLATGKVEVWASTTRSSSSQKITAKQGKRLSVKTIKLKSHPQGTLTGTVKGLKDGDSVWAYDVKNKYAFMLLVADAKTEKINEKLAPGTYRLVVGGTNKASKSVTVRNKKKVSAGTLTAPSKRTKVSGTVKGSNGKVLKDAYVWVTDSFGTAVGNSVDTDAKGKYSVSGAVSGKYTVTVSDPKAKDASAVDKLTVKNGKNATKNLKLPKGYTIKGTVKYKSRAIEGISIYSSSSATFRSTETDAKGKFRLTGLGKGSTQLHAYDSYVGGFLNADKKVTVKKNLTWNISLKK